MKGPTTNFMNGHSNILFLLMSEPQANNKSYNERNRRKSVVECKSNKLGSKDRRQS